MIDRHLVEKKLRKMEEFLRELESAGVDTFEDFKGDVVRKRFIERNIELTIEQMIDVCKHLVSGLDLGEPETYSECFDMLCREEIVQKENLDTFKAMIRFRNFLIHAYDGIDDSVTYGIYAQRLSDFGAFIKSMREFLLKGS